MRTAYLLKNTVATEQFTALERGLAGQARCTSTLAGIANRYLTASEHALY